MPNAKETLDRIAQAIGIATADKVEEVKEATEDVADVSTEEVEETIIEDTTEEPTVEVVEEVAEEAVKETTEEVVEDAVEADEAPKDEDRVKELEDQIKSLKEILRDALKNDVDDVKEKTEKTEDVKTPEVPVDDKGLTHSPEATVTKKSKKIGDKGGSIMSNVFKYINN